jgi:large subunit ribosomal protein L5
MKGALEKDYKERIVGEIQKRLGLKNTYQVPRLLKVVVNAGVGDAIQDPKYLDSMVKELALITGQKPVVRRAKKSISNFRVRAGMPIGCSVTLRGSRMYYFLERLIHVAIPRIRDFRGINPRSFDGRGNFTFGIREQIIFPEVNYDEAAKVRGFDVTIVTSAKKDDEAYLLLDLIGIPFRRPSPSAA